VTAPVPLAPVSMAYSSPPLSPRPRRPCVAASSSEVGTHLTNTSFVRILSGSRLTDGRQKNGLSSPPGGHEFTDTAPQGVARGIEGGADVVTLAAKIDRLSTHRSASFEPDRFELMRGWHSSEWALQTILLGRFDCVLKSIEAPPQGQGGLVAKLLQVHFACLAPECETRLFYRHPSWPLAR